MLDSETNAPEGRDNATYSPQRRDAVVAQADRLVSALQRNGSTKATRLEYVVGVTTPAEAMDMSSPSPSNRQHVTIQYGDVLLERMSHGTIPVIPNIGYMTETQKVTHVDADDIMLALAREFAGLNYQSDKVKQTSGQDAILSTAHAKPGDVTLDRIVLLDPVGGIPSVSRADKPHIFINLDQEYEDIRDELLHAYNTQGELVHAIDHVQSTTSEKTLSTFAKSNPFTSFVEEEITSIARPSESTTVLPSSIDLSRHLKNLDLLQNTLCILPSSSSAMLTTPLEAATLTEAQSTDLGVRTRRPKNPLIYNLLTDKPLISSSLPVARLHPNADPLTVARGATFIKKGMPLRMVPNPRDASWRPPSAAAPAITLDAHPDIDFPRLLNLIEDSFGRPLDVQHYLNRIAGRLAGVIVAGDYEGGAILTWELPPGVPNDGSEASRARMVPYLDKFAVLKRSQGAGGVADVVFTAMVRTCFPEGVCWRSRRTNPVNKWYFERSIGTFKVDRQWTMFWTDEDIFASPQRWLDYEAVCRSVQPSWADNKKVVD